VFIGEKAGHELPQGGKPAGRSVARMGAGAAAGACRRCWPLRPASTPSR